MCCLCTCKCLKELFQSCKKCCKRLTFKRFLRLLRLGGSSSDQQDNDQINLGDINIVVGENRELITNKLVDTFEKTKYGMLDKTNEFKSLSECVICLE